MILLTATTHTLEVTTSSTSAINYTIGYVDNTTTDYTPISVEGNITTATTTTVVAAPAASTQRNVVSLFLFNNGSAANVVTIKKDVSATEYVLAKFTLAAGYSVQYTKDTGFKLKDPSGREVAASDDAAGNTGLTTAFFKVGTAPEAAGQWYCFAKDTGNPGAWAPGTPGTVGRATDGTSGADAGCLPLRNATGANYLTSLSFVGTQTGNPWLFDLMWVNTGVVVTTTTAQNWTAVALPARDLSGTTNGEGCWAGVLVTAATTNAGAVTNMQIGYTNSAGTASRVGTMASFPATATVGTVVWFQLQGGDMGVRSIESITLGTSLVTGSVSVIIARPIVNQAVLLANVGGAFIPPQNPGIRLYNQTCLIPFTIASNTTGVTLTGSFQIMDR